MIYSEVSDQSVWRISKPSPTSLQPGSIELPGSLTLVAYLRHTLPFLIARPRGSIPYFPCLQERVWNASERE
ncbi:hypothetical protein Scep_014152 [Stephania cephalantha]|uniref:Uncharacterized protein n=1 Tax=Stephania cephalantha TaxID=152367 RepID=A0AAP0P2Q5_9MAGN